MSDWHAPNQQSVGVDPASGGGVAPPPDGGGEEVIDPPDGTFDPSAHTVTEVNAYLTTASPEEYDRVMAAEVAGKNRSTITGG